MNATTVAVDLAKNVYQVAVADENWRVIEKHRLTRTQFERFFGNRAVKRVIMEACGSAHYWARHIQALGVEVKLLPPRYVRAYVKRNKTDVADAAALLEAARCSDIVPVRIKSVEQQTLQTLHRIRSVWMRTRTARINSLRGYCREFGLSIAQGARVGLEQIARVLADPNSQLPCVLRPMMRLLIDEIPVTRSSDRRSREATRRVRAIVTGLCDVVVDPRRRTSDRNGNRGSDLR